jgi:Xaa-Pro aminopeptidase
LKGHIQLALAIFPSKTRAELLDSFARRPLWNEGLDYRHGTGHGVGALLNVHELPIISYRGQGDVITVNPNMIMTIEPGFYEDNSIGIRIENCYLVREATKTKYKMKDNNDLPFCAFESLTYVPIQKELIKVSLLNDDELKWINDYHKKCFDLIGNDVKKLNKPDIYEWFIEQTKSL